MKLTATLVALVSLSALSFAADVVGKWTGKMEITTDKSVKGEMKAQMPKAPVLSLELRADKTYKGSQTGGFDGKDHSAEGKWSLSGSTLTLTPLKRDGKVAAGEGAKPRVYTLSKDGKTLTLDLTDAVKASAKGATGGKPIPKFTAKMILHKTK